MSYLLYSKIFFKKCFKLIQSKYGSCTALEMCVPKQTDSDINIPFSFPVSSVLMIHVYNMRGYTQEGRHLLRRSTATPWQPKATAANNPKVPRSHGISSKNVYHKNQCPWKSDVFYSMVSNVTVVELGPFECKDTSRQSNEKVYACYNLKRDDPYSCDCINSYISTYRHHIAYWHYC